MTSPPTNSTSWRRPTSRIEGGNFVFSRTGGDEEGEEEGERVKKRKASRTHGLYTVRQ